MEASEDRTCLCGCGEKPRAGQWFAWGHMRGDRGAEARTKVTGRPVSTAHVGGTHRWLHRNFPLTKCCEECGRKGRTEFAFLRHPKKHTRNREDYRELCRSCHFKMDEPVMNRGRSLNASLTREQRQAAGRKGAFVRWNLASEGS